MAVEVGDRALSLLISKADDLNFCTSAYKAFRSVGTKRHYDSTMASLAYLRPAALLQVAEGSGEGMCK